MLYLYDVCLKRHIKDVYTYSYLSERTQLFKKIRNEMDSASKDRNLKLPIVGIWRTENTLEADTRNLSEFFTGVKTSTPIQGRLSILKALSVPLTYQIDVIGRTMEEADNLLTDLMVYLTQNPNVSISLYGITFELALYITELNMSTDFGSGDDKGMLYTQTLTVRLPEARFLFIDKYGSVDRIVVDMYLSENDYNFENMVEEVLVDTITIE